MENWKAIAGYEGYYEVSDQGRVRSLDRTVNFADGRQRFYAGRMCNSKAHEAGYPLVLLSRGVALKRWALVHQLVAEAFLGPCPSGQEVCHENGVPVDVRLENLRYDTRKGNAADMQRHGTLRCGATHQSARFSDSLIAAVREAVGTITSIATANGLSRTHVWNIRNEKRRSTS